MRDLRNLARKRWKCQPCRDGNHDECFDIVVNIGAFDALDFMPPMCGCKCGEDGAMDRMYRAEWYANYHSHGQACDA